MNDPILFSDRFTGKILLRYFSLGHEGLFYIDIRKLKKQIEMMNTLAVIGSAHIERFSLVQAYLPDKIQSVLFQPNQPLSLLSNNPVFTEGFSKRVNYWHVEKFHYKKIIKNWMMIAEVLHIEVSTDGVGFCVIPYENKFFNTRAFTVRLPLKELLK